MSEKQMTAEDARSALGATRLTDRHITMRRGDAVAFFHTVIAQAEQIQRLQAAVEHALYYSTESTSDLIQADIITKEDME